MPGVLRDMLIDFVAADLNAPTTVDNEFAIGFAN